MSSPRLLLVSPTFHGYWRSLESALTDLGHETTTVRFDERSPRGKVRHKVAVELPSKLGRDTDQAQRDEATDRAVAAIRALRPRVVLAVKGDLLDEPFHEAVAAVGATSVVWVYDELANTAFSDTALRRFHHVASYSARDTEELNRRGIATILVRDAFDPHLPFTVRPTPEVVQIGALYPARQAALERLHRDGIPVRTYGRQWSHHPLDRARTWGRARPDLPSGREMSRSSSQGLMSGAPAALNIHGTHDGFNMRTFEAAGAGAVQLIDRADVAELYEPGTEILPYSSLDELSDLAARAVREPRWGDRVRAAGRRRTLAEHTFAHRMKQLEDLWA